MPPVIQISNISKIYRLGEIGTGTISHDLERWYKMKIKGQEDPFLKIGETNERSKKGASDIVYSLHDINFEVQQGDALGIIGKNGAGKSTLLKILSQVTSPTTGKIKIKGRIASLLEVGTGFHPELTGRENIFLNRAILGMRKKEIEQKLDEIVCFAGIERYIDTPVKRYSSGMYVRLAFAIAAHLESEILIIDEVLAVGDAEFQKKAIGKIQGISGEKGRTVLFVSHNMNLIERVCNIGLMLENGKILKHSNNVREVVKSYLFSNNNNSVSEWINHDGLQFKNKYFIPLNMFICDKYGAKMGMPLSNSDDMYINIDLNILQIDPSLNVGYSIYDEESKIIFWSLNTDSCESKWPKLEIGLCSLKSRIPKRLLNEGSYRIGLLAGLHNREFLSNPDKDAPSIFFTIQGGLSDSPLWTEKRYGVIAPVINWYISKSS